jgi:hypothetical protein
MCLIVISNVIPRTDLVGFGLRVRIYVGYLQAQR